MCLVQCAYRDVVKLLFGLMFTLHLHPYTSSYYLIISIDKRLSSCERKLLDYSKSKMTGGSYLMILKYMYEE